LRGGPWEKECQICRFGRLLQTERMECLGSSSQGGGRKFPSTVYLENVPEDWQDRNQEEGIKLSNSLLMLQRGHRVGSGLEGKSHPGDLTIAGNDQSLPTPSTWGGSGKGVETPDDGWSPSDDACHLGSPGVHRQDEIIMLIRTSPYWISSEDFTFSSLNLWEEV